MTMGRLWWRMNRRIILLLAVVTAVASVASVIYASTITCDAGLRPADCARFLNTNPPSTVASALIAILPILAGLAFGVDAVGRETEDGTTAFAWSIVSNRWRWLIERILPGVLATVFLGLVCGVVGAVVVAKLNPGHNIAASFVGYGLWGPILIARGLCAYAIGLGLGAMTGRVVASVALGLLVVTIVTPAALIVGRSYEPAQTIPNGDSRISDALGVEFGALAPNGEFIQSTECLGLAPADLDPAAKDAWVSAHCPFISSYLLGPQMPIVELRESATLGAAAFVFGGIAFAVVANRRP
jgi:ABC-type transport system involved in multi-copper enzyme maturation permease subunit